MNKNDNEGSFVSHLVELRKRLINSFIFLIVGAIHSFIYG